jgi:hypothetical protein
LRALRRFELKLDLFHFDRGGFWFRLRRLLWSIRGTLYRLRRLLRSIRGTLQLGFFRLWS